MQKITRQPMQLGEGPLWHQGRLLWVDLVAGRSWQSGADGEVLLTDREMLTSLVPGKDGSLYATSATGFRRGVAAPEPIGGLAITDARLRFNDGKADPFGNYWAGTMDRSCQAPDWGTLYLLTPGGQVKPMLAGIGVSNGLAWSADGTVFYYIDSLRQKIEAFDFHPGRLEISRRRTVLDIPGQALPDGMCIDRDGLLWCALWAGQSVIAVDPKRGSIEHRLAVPAYHATSCCFGGAGLDELFITTASIEVPPDRVAEFPDSGHVFRCTPGARGLPADTYG